MIRVYKYGCRPPTANAALVREQIRAADRYRNTLTEIERGRRAALRPLLSQPEIVALEAALREADTSCEEAARAVKIARAESRHRSETQEMRERLTAARLRRRDVSHELAKARSAQRRDPAIVSAKDAVHAKALELQKSARAYCGVYWGTYLLVEDAAGKAFESTPLYDGAMPSDPRFRRSDGTGSVGVQLQGGLSVPLAFGGDTRLRIERSSDDRYATLRIRVGSDGRVPVWASWPMKLHRPLPPSATIKRVTVSYRRIGPRDVWSVQFTLDMPDAVTPTSEHRCAIDLGWRKMADGSIRVAYVVGTDGYKDDVRLPTRLVEAFGRAEGIRSVRDHDFNEARVKLSEAIKALSTVPAWLTDATRTLPQWRSPARMASVAKRWSTERFDGDEEVYVALEQWRYRDHHLWQYESDERVKHIGHRRDIYRVLARRLADRYGRIALEDFDLRDVAARAPIEAEYDNETARANRQAVAVSELRQSIVQAFGKSRVDVVSSVDSTHICRSCGSVEVFDASASILHRCTACSVIWDQDENAAHVLLLRGERFGDADPAGVARNGDEGNDSGPVETRWQRAARLARERETRKEVAAREASGKAAECLGTC